jgi:hypothetical protein
MSEDRTLEEIVAEADARDRLREQDEEIARLRGVIDRLEEQRAARREPPTRMHPEDFHALSMREFERISEQISDGRIVIDPAAEKGAWRKAKPKMSIIRVLALPLAEFEKVHAAAERGEIEITRE